VVDLVSAITREHLRLRRITTGAVFRVANLDLAHFYLISLNWSRFLRDFGEAFSSSVTRYMISTHCELNRWIIYGIEYENL